MVAAPPQPPVTSTRPSGRMVAVCDERAKPMLPASMTEPSRAVCTSSAVAMTVPDASMPPATSTLPCVRRVAEWA